MKADYFNFAFKSLKKRKLRSWLTVIGIVMSIAIIFFLISVSVGLKDAVNEQFRTLGTDKLIIMPKGMISSSGSTGPVKLTTLDVDEIEKVRGVKAVSYYLSGNGKLEFKDEIKYYLIVGFPLEPKDLKMISEASGWKIDEGRLLQKGDVGKVLVGSQYKYNNYFKKVVKVGDKIKVNDIEFKVVGILKSVGNPADDKHIFLAYDDVKKMLNTGDRVDMIYGQVDSGENIKEVAKRVEDKLIKFRGLTIKTKDFDILTPEEILASLNIILNIITAFLVGVAAISLLVGAIGIANTMYTSVLERTKEIGTMKAIGARNSDVLTLFLLESGFIGLLGGIIGILIGMGLAKIVEIVAAGYLASDLLKVAFPMWLIVGALSFGFLIGSLSGFFPALQAARLRPVDALRYE